jgi:hypothetical protein
MTGNDRRNLFDADSQPTRDIGEGPSIAMDSWIVGVLEIDVHGRIDA